MTPQQAEDLRVLIRHVERMSRAEVDPQEWASEARKILAEHGYTMDAAPDAARARFKDRLAFAEFKARVLKPVEL